MARKAGQIMARREPHQSGWAATRASLGVHMPALRNRLSRPRRWIGFSVGAEAVALGGGSDCITVR